MNDTHNPLRRSWVDSANRPGTAFPIQNLPLGVFYAPDGDSIGVAIGDYVLNLRGCASLLEPAPPGIAELCAADTLNPLMRLGAAHWSALRERLSDLLRADHPDAARHQKSLEPHLTRMADVTMRKPATIGGYTDFYASIDHARTVGGFFRPEMPLLANYKYVPIGYNGRVSSIVLSGEAITRPAGQIVAVPGAAPEFAPTRRLDFELETGVFVGTGNRLGQPIPIHDADSHLFGVCLLNDWSARDIQAWEYQPLGPFLAKSFATTISPWIVTFEALAPFRVAAAPRPSQDPLPLPYLLSEQDQQTGAIDLTLEAYLRSARMREAGMPAIRLTRTNLRELYWTPAQLLTHHTSNGCNLEPGDLLGSGTVSGPTLQSRGCLLELAQNGREPVTLPTGERRSFLEDGDEVTLRGHCERQGFVSIGLGECAGIITNA
jgi:fumarylacetoacetase